MPQKKNGDPAYSAGHSKVRLWVSMKNETREVFYSFLAEDRRKETPQIIQTMHRRLLQNYLRGKYKVAVFYCNRTGKELVRYDASGCRILP
jgi:hypothetical protein